MAIDLQWLPKAITKYYGSREYRITRAERAPTDNLILVRYIVEFVSVVEDKVLAGEERQDTWAKIQGEWTLLRPKD